MFGFDLALILGGLAAALGVVARVLWGQNKKHKKEAKIARREVRRRILVQEEDGRIDAETEKKRDEIRESTGDDLRNRLLDPDR